MVTQATNDQSSSSHSSNSIDQDNDEARLAPPFHGNDAQANDAQHDNGADIDIVLLAWQQATDRLQQTQETLRVELCRLSNELERKNAELARKNRLADLGQMAAHVAHEVRNCMLPLKLYMGLLERHVPAQESSRDLFRKFNSGFTALETIVNDLLHFTAERNPVWQEFDLRSLVREVVDPLNGQFHAQAIEVDVDIPFRQAIVADVDMLRRAILNLVLNAVDAMPNGGELYLTSHLEFDRVEIEVADSGAGLSDEQLRRVCEPFYTTKTAGTGLGLSIVERVVTVHGGQLSVMNCPEGGAAFTLVIPQRRHQLKAAA
jgi:signal transduction histidine kinase